MNLTQIGSNQTEIELPNGVTVFFSYNTPVAVFAPGKGALVTDEYHSATTSRHINAAVKRWGCGQTRVAPAEIEKYTRGV